MLLNIDFDCLFHILNIYFLLKIIMANSYFNSHPMSIKGTQYWYNIKNMCAKFQSETGHILDHLKRDIKILEIGFWKWDFAYYCHTKGFSNYTGIDIDDTFLKKNEKRFPEYKFSADDISTFFINNTWYDIIFMAHVFEHLDEKEANETVSLIYSSLTTWWYWINYMPNADSHKACALRYHDITHKKIYNSHSFEQILLTNDAMFSNINHYNTLPSLSPFIRFLFKIIHPFFLIPTKIYFAGMWILFPTVYSSEILSIMKK